MFIFANGMIGQPHTIPRPQIVVHAALWLFTGGDPLPYFSVPDAWIREIIPQARVFISCVSLATLVCRSSAYRYLQRCRYLLMEYLHQSKGFDEAVLRRQYGYFRDQPAKIFVEARVKLMTLESGAALPSPSNKQGSWDTFSTPNDITTERYFTEYLEPVLRSRSLDHPCLQIW